jgi:hypothetical protein
MNSTTTAGTPEDCNVYDVSIGIPGSGTAAMPLILGTVAVAESSLLSLGFHALIGRDILENCMFHYNGPMKLLAVSY